jgi:hypothetical protein
MFDSGIHIGDRVRWESSAGIIHGEIINIRIGRNGHNKLVPWITIEHIDNNMTRTTTLCGTDDNLAMMKFKVNFRDNYRCKEKEAA